MKKVISTAVAATMIFGCLTAVTMASEIKYETVFDASTLTRGGLNDAAVGDKWSGWSVEGANANLKTYNEIDYLQMYRTKNENDGTPVVIAPNGGYGNGADSFKISFIMRSTGFAHCVLEDINGNYIGGYSFCEPNVGFWAGSGEKMYCSESDKTDANGDKRLSTYLKSDIVTGDKSGVKTFTDDSSIMTITVTNYEADEMYDFAYHTVNFTMTDDGIDTVLSTEYYSGKANGFKALHSWTDNNSWAHVGYGNLKIEVATEETSEIKPATKYTGYTNNEDYANADAVGFTADIASSEFSNTPSLTWYLSNNNGESYKELTSGKLPTISGESIVKVGLIVYGLPVSVSADTLSAGYSVQ